MNFSDYIILYPDFVEELIFLFFSQIMHKFSGPPVYSGFLFFKIHGIFVKKLFILINIYFMIESQKFLQQMLVGAVISGDQVSLPSNFTPDSFASKIAGNHWGLRSKVDSIFEFRFFYGIYVEVISENTFCGDFKTSVIQNINTEDFGNNSWSYGSCSISWGWIQSYLPQAMAPRVATIVKYEEVAEVIP